MQRLTTRIIRPAIIAAAVLAVAAPAAQARPFNGSGGSAATVHAANGVTRSHSGLISSGRGRMTVVQPTSPAVAGHVKTGTAFNWTDAALGAASGLAATLIALAGAMALRGRRRMALSA